MQRGGKPSEILRLGLSRPFGVPDTHDCGVDSRLIPSSLWKLYGAARKFRVIET